MTDLIEIHVDHSDRASLVGKLPLFCKGTESNLDF